MRLVFVCFLEQIEDIKKTFRNLPTFIYHTNIILNPQLVYFLPHFHCDLYCRELPLVLQTIVHIRGCKSIAGYNGAHMGLTFCRQHAISDNLITSSVKRFIIILAVSVDLRVFRIITI